ncbi:hypothetical protein [Oscillatoria sp. FACHB-1406]|uniref:hypothetical protein n=1 Tax=Oscillatoria sp. FACHB-1406 TaxID=2692846 RepID=UPI001686421E|nr:hypothetical protein [Oscillatoria sp. FACHB-1406]MBD2578792.1 hypothetical protein [Oscillatoria sp. FACHB-1406]
MPLKTLNLNLKLGTAIQAHPLTTSPNYRRIAARRIQPADSRKRFGNATGLQTPLNRLRGV